MTTTATVSLNTRVDLALVSCYSCGITFGLPVEYNRDRINDRRSWHCPNGHAQHYTGKTDAEKERERADRLAAQLTHSRDQANAAEQSNVALRGVITRTKRRVGNGVCPCCNRTFRDLANHMASQHPDYAANGADQ